MQYATLIGTMVLQARPDEIVSKWRGYGLIGCIQCFFRKNDDLLMPDALSKYQQKLELPGDAIKDAGLRGAYKWIKRFYEGMVKTTCPL